MKKYLLLAIMALAALAGHAEFNRLVFHTVDGNVQSVGVTDLNITFSDGEMTATSAGESIKLPLASLQSMEFSSDMSGIDAATDDSAPEGPVVVYNATGQSLGRYDSATSALTTLSQGFYIFKADNGSTYKILINR